MKRESQLVYSTSGELGANFKKSSQQRQTAGNTQETNGVVRIYRQTKGRKGSGVSIIVGLNLDEPSSKALARKLKQKLAVGGSIKQGNIELQTTERQRIKEYLQSEGYQVKIAGG